MAEAGTLNIKLEVPDACLVDYLRDLADQHHGIANALEEMANRQARMDEDPGFAQRIQEAEDQVMGEDLLNEMQDPAPLSDAQRSVIHGAVEDAARLNGCKTCGEPSGQDPKEAKTPPAGHPENTDENTNKDGP